VSATFCERGITQFNSVATTEFASPSPSPSFAKISRSSQGPIRDVSVDVAHWHPAEESTKTIDGRLLVTLQWRHMDTIYSTRVQALAAHITGDP
jgi:hypothetical protein